MNHSLSWVTGAALAAFLVAPSAAAQRVAPADSDAPGTLVEQTHARGQDSGVSDQDRPGVRNAPTQQAPALSVADRDDASAPRVQSIETGETAALNAGRHGFTPGLVLELTAPNENPEGREPHTEVLASAPPSVRLETPDGRSLDARPSAVTSPDAAKTNEPVLSSPDQLAVSEVSLGVNVPNPARDLTQITFAVDTAGHALVEVFDTSGRRVAVLHDAVVEAGASTVVQLDTRSLASGSYIYTLTTPQGVISRTLQVVR